MADDETTRLLEELSDGKAQAAEVLLPLVYEELRMLAKRYLQRQPSDHTLQPTSLVHEAYIRLVGDDLSESARASRRGRAAARAFSFSKSWRPDVPR